MEVLIGTALHDTVYHRPVENDDGELDAACTAPVSTAYGADVTSVDHAEATGHTPCPDCWSR